MQLFSRLSAAALLAGMTLGGGAALADTIDPISFSGTLAVGESVTVRKTVVVQAEGTRDAVIDAHFLFDTSGSMGSAIAGAKTAAPAILAGLSTFGDLASSVGVYSERALVGDAIRSGLSNSDATTIAAINAVTLGDPDGGGDYPESGDTAIYNAVENLSWRPGSNRYVFVLSDASMKGTDEATVLASLADKGVTVIGLQFGGNCFAGEPGECNLTESVAALGGTTYASTASPDAIVAAITAGLEASLARYSIVTVGDLGGAMPEIGVSTICVSAGIGSCIGADAVGDYDRGIDRSFEFDVTFTRVAAGDRSFETYALVNGGIVAREADRFDDVAPVPLPAAGLLLMAALGVLPLARRRRAA